MKLRASTGGSCTISGRLSKWRRNSAVMPSRQPQYNNTLETDSPMNIRSLLLGGCVSILSLAFHVPVAFGQVPSDREILISRSESATETPVELVGYPTPGRVLGLEKY